ncbi:hypothetical protein [Mucilaginibacter glaciei]|uniref:Uncharacterized protein n=1 Tax=Mucilaginibacter glaciei TaxID=2772109 RepID=A0A926S1I3_9SPHI|nr:hypothetical protein [Mucilaginibacter glaciei]MBD1393113.1 hypothetical protein [Mucilaginibacter glaciei]
MDKFIRVFFSVLSLLTLLSFSASAQEKGDPPPAMPGLEIKRSYLIKQMQSSDSTLIFKEVPKIDGEESYLAVDKDGSSMQFFGKENYLKKVSFTFKFTTYKDVNLLQYKRMSYFAFLMGGDKCLKWFEHCAAEFVKDKTKFFTDKANFDFNRKGVYTYNPANKAMVLTFIEW